MNETMRAAMLIAGVLLVGCGSAPTSLEICKHACDKQGSCGASGVEACKAACENMRAQFSDLDALLDTTCKNAADIRSESYDCFGRFCDIDLGQQCADAAGAKCIQK